jgi:hypothetical protein
VLPNSPVDWVINLQSLKERSGDRESQSLQLRAVDGQTAPYCLFLRPESPFGRGALDLALESAFIQVARLDCTGRQDFIVSVAG